MTAGGTARSRTARGRTVAYGLLAGGGLAMLIIAGLPWYRVNGQAGFTGTDVSGGLAPIVGVVALAGVLLMLTQRRTGQRITAALIAVLALITAVALQFSRPSESEIIVELRKQSLADNYDLSWTGGGPGYGVAALAVAAGAILVLLRAHRWPTRAARFERAAGDAGGDTAGAAATDTEPDPTSIWKALDAGEDPTATADGSAVRDESAGR